MAYLCKAKPALDSVPKKNPDRNRNEPGTNYLQGGGARLAVFSVPKSFHSLCVHQLSNKIYSIYKILWISMEKNNETDCKFHEREVNKLTV